MGGGCSIGVKPSILRDRLSVRKGQDVVLITDDMQVAKFFSKEARWIGAILTVVILPEKIRPLRQVSELLRSAIQHSDVLLTVFEKRLEEASLRKEIISLVIEKKSSRLAHMPNVDIDTIANCILNTDYQEVKKLGYPLVEVMARARQIKILSKRGTNLSLDLGGWEIPADAGFGEIDARGGWDNLPGGEVFKIPREGSTNGKLIIDGAIPGKVLSEHEEIILQISNGKVIDIEDKSNYRFADYLKNIDYNASDDMKGGIYKICELGIGINRAARKVPKAVEYEKRLGTIHIALGDNTSFRGTIRAPEHLDLMIESPTLYVNDILIMQDGKLIDDDFIKVCNCNIEAYKPQILVKMTEVTKFIPTTEYGICGIENEMLYRQWKSPGEATFRTKVGDDNAARLAAKAWQEIRKAKEGICFRDIKKSLGLSREHCLNLLGMLHDTGIIKIENEW
jgi:leucyl aminopeptidase (aminopeptidase T)